MKTQLIDIKQQYFLFKRTVAGVLGENGANVRKRVALGHSIEYGPVPGLLQDMEESAVLDQIKRLGHATHDIAPVSIT